MILALDISSKTGWAAETRNGIKSGVKDLSNYLSDYPAMGYRLNQWLLDFLTDHDELDTVIVERAFIRNSGDITHLLHGLNFLCKVTAHARGLQVREAPSAEVKKFATGNGNANKAAMIEAVRGWGFRPYDDNEADALAILTWAKEQRK